VSLDRFRAHYRDDTAALRAYASTHSIYHPLYSDLDYPRRHVVWPDMHNLADLLAGGRQPLYLAQALLDRRFDAVVPFASALGPAWRAHFDLYGSAYGDHEGGYFWKLDRVIAARYVAPAPGSAPTGVLVRRPGPERGAWMRTCFGPFAVSGAEFAIRSGGGFWCHAPGAPTLALRGTPAPASELVTAGAVAPRGTLVVRPGPRANAFAVWLGGTWRLGATLHGARWSLALTTGGRRTTATAIGRVLRLRFCAGSPGLRVAGGGVDLCAGAGASGRLSLWGTRRGGVVYDLAGLRLH
jgi:hypothetical protein